MNVLQGVYSFLIGSECMHEVPLAMSMTGVKFFVHLILTRLVERHLLEEKSQRNATLQLRLKTMQQFRVIIILTSQHMGIGHRTCLPAWATSTFKTPCKFCFVVVNDYATTCNSNESQMQNILRVCFNNNIEKDLKTQTLTLTLNQILNLECYTLHCVRGCLTNGRFSKGLEQCHVLYMLIPKGWSKSTPNRLKQFSSIHTLIKKTHALLMMILAI